MNLQGDFHLLPPSYGLILDSFLTDSWLIPSLSSILRLRLGSSSVSSRRGADKPASQKRAPLKGLLSFYVFFLPPTARDPPY